MSICGASLASFTNIFLHEYAFRNMANDWRKMINLKKKVNVDSLKVHSIIKYTPDNLTRQMVLTELFSQHLYGNQIKLFETYKEIAEKNIKEPFLKKPLFDLYKKVKKRHDNTENEDSVFITKAKNSSVKEIMDSIKYQNKRKIIYIDYWATWCAPCRDEMPSSKKLMKDFKGKDISFIYVCLDSKEDGWQASLNQFKLEGQHYFMTKDQSKDMKDLYKFSGIPFHILIGKDGKLIDKGYHLGPSVVKKQIENLLD
jgi:thiol-disulfide isomerase/thioredoxin